MPADDTPFRFAEEGRDLVDRANGLRIHCYQWPEYAFTITVEPIAGEQAEAWPVARRAYFEFAAGTRDEGAEKVCALSMALAHEPFERDFPGRSEELLDVVLPIIMPMDLMTFPRRPDNVRSVVSARMRPLLREKGSYFRHRDDPGTFEHRQANPWLYPVETAARRLARNWRRTLSRILP